LQCAKIKIDQEVRVVVKNKVARFLLSHDVYSEYKTVLDHTDDVQSKCH